MKESEVRQKAEEHWDWIERLLMQQLQVTRKLFIDSWIHSHKHAMEDKDENKSTGQT